LTNDQARFDLSYLTTTFHHEIKSRIQDQEGMLKSLHNKYDCVKCYLKNTFTKVREVRGSFLQEFLSLPEKSTKH
jgi:hypothetical protein